MPKDIIQKSQEYFYTTIKPTKDKYGLLFHVPEAIKLAERMLRSYLKADRTVLLAAVWLHDIAHYDGDQKYDSFDHAVAGEAKARNFLTGKVDQNTIDAIAHCVRSHRNRDVAPATLEAKILACVDSASHMTDSMYIDIIKRGHHNYAADKLERDYRDMAAFPKVQKELTRLYKAWKELLESFKEVKEKND